MKRLPDQVTVVFDGTCNFCTWTIQQLDWLDRHQRVRVQPFQGPGVLARYGLTQAQTEEAAWAITPRGNRYQGAAAVNLTVAVALGTRLPYLIYRLPGVRQLQDALYGLIARNRRFIRGVVPYCKQHPKACAG
jgi:predicted DCC family thiol-disulfide oxidoreductase YuxK